MSDTPTHHQELKTLKPTRESQSFSKLDTSIECQAEVSVATDRQDDMTKTLVSVDGTKIYANAIGNPKNQAIVFIHGLAWSLMAFDDIFINPRWTSQFYLVRYDVRGHGRSGKPGADEAWESKRFAEDFDTVVNAFKLHKPFVASWSLGAAHLMDILSFHSTDYVLGIINIAGATFMKENVLQESATTFALECIQGLMSSSTVSAFQEAAGNFIDGCCRTLPYHVRRACLGNIMTQPQEMMKRSLTRRQNEQIFKKTGMSSLPCLVICGDKDELVLVERLHEPYKDWKNVVIEIVEGGSHVPWSETDKRAAADFNERC